MSEANRCLNRIEELSSNDEENREGEYPRENEQRKNNRYSSSNISEVGSSIPTSSLDNHGNVQRTTMNPEEVFTGFQSFSRFREDGNADREDDLNGNSSLEAPMKIESSTSSASASKSVPQSLRTSSRFGSAADAPSVGFRRRSAPVTRDMRPDPVMVKMLKKIRDIQDDCPSDASDSSVPSEMNRTM